MGNGLGLRQCGQTYKHNALHILFAVLRYSWAPSAGGGLIMISFLGLISFSCLPQFWVTVWCRGGNKHIERKISRLRLLFDDALFGKSPDHMLTSILTVMCDSWLCTTHNSSILSVSLLTFQWQWTVYTVCETTFFLMKNKFKFRISFFFFQNK